MIGSDTSDYKRDLKNKTRVRKDKKDSETKREKRNKKETKEKDKETKRIPREERLNDKNKFLLSLCFRVGR